MKLKITTPFALNEIGGRSNNEDSIYPTKGNATQEDTLFVVCDGVGGAEKGEVASRLVCEGFAFYFQQKLMGEDALYDKEFVRGALAYAQGKIDEYLLENPEAKGMGTTLTLVHFNAQGATIAHVGDSRVYHIRGKEIMFKTQDHSFVNGLVRDGIISEEEAKTHPKRNVITRAIQGNSVKPTAADVFVQTDIQKGDYFFLCTDGILEQITDELLVEIVSSDTGNEEKIKRINACCKDRTKDNYSCYLIPIEKGTNDHAEAEAIPMGTVIEEQATDNESDSSVKPIAKLGTALRNAFKNYFKKK